MNISSKSITSLEAYWLHVGAMGDLARVEGVKNLGSETGR